MITMNETKIIINGKEVKIRFGSYVISLLAEVGIALVDFGEAVQKDPIGVIAKVIYFGAVNASEGKRGADITQGDIFDWIDAQDGGFTSDEVTRLFELFGKYLEFGVTKKKPKVKDKPLNQTTTK